MLSYCDEKIHKDPFKVDQLLELVIHRLFVDMSSQVADWRVVTIQENFIKQIIDRSKSINDIMSDPILLKFFQQLTETNEARRCLHYLFRVKCERIDTSFFTVKNLQKIYKKFQESGRASEKGSNSINDRNSLSTLGSTDEPRGSDAGLHDKSEASKSKKQREYQFYMEMFSQLLDIVDAISG